MYKREEVRNLYHNNTYELTEMDRKIYEETEYVIHQVDGIFEYKQYFGSCLGQTVVDIYKDGTIRGERWFITNGGDDKDFEVVELPEKLIELAKLKYQELMNGYWKE